MIEFLEDQSEKRNISSIICQALTEYLPKLGVRIPDPDEENGSVEVKVG